MVFSGLALQLDNRSKPICSMLFSIVDVFGFMQQVNRPVPKTLQLLNNSTGKRSMMLAIKSALTSPSPQHCMFRKTCFSFKSCRGRRSGVIFPSSYPTSCLLGSVDVTDWMAQEEYRESHPGGESASPYVAVCTNPQVGLSLP